MEKLPTELIHNIIDAGNYDKINKLCLTNKKNESICESYFSHKIKQLFKSSSQIFGELMLKLDIVVDIPRQNPNNSIYIHTYIRRAYGKSKFKKILVKYINDYMTLHDVDTPFQDYTGRNFYYLINRMKYGFNLFISNYPGRGHDLKIVIITNDIKQYIDELHKMFHGKFILEYDEYDLDDPEA
jgi:hypothetical protein